jgi:hypothetical protein
MSGRTAFAYYDLSEPRFFFFADYVAVMIMIACIGIAAAKHMKKTPLSE